MKNAPLVHSIILYELSIKNTITLKKYQLLNTIQQHLIQEQLKLRRNIEDDGYDAIEKVPEIDVANKMNSKINTATFQFMQVNQLQY